MSEQLNNLLPDQFIETVNIMVRRCGGSSTEFVIAQLVKGAAHPHHLILGACEEGKPDELVAWMFTSFIPDTLSPRAEVWGLWCKPGFAMPLRDMAMDHLLAWCKERGAKRIMSILTRNPRVFLKMLHETVGFKQVGIVVQKELGDASG